MATPGEERLSGCFSVAIVRAHPLTKTLATPRNAHRPGSVQFRSTLTRSGLGPCLVRTIRSVPLSGHLFRRLPSGGRPAYDTYK